MQRQTLWTILVVFSLITQQAQGQTPLHQQLVKEDVVNLARDARTSGDPARGALLFYQPHLGCAKCHRIPSEGVGVGPDLSKPGPDFTDVYLVESILHPSKVIKKGYESITLTTTKGKLITGVLVEDRPDAIVMRDPNQDESLLTVLRKDIEERRQSPLSLMPEQLMNLLATRQEFLDLIRYVMEIADKGPTRVLALRPDHVLIGRAPLPEYEKNLDHAGLIKGWDKQSFNRGEKIYTHLCITCHGTREQAGSLPTALRFAGDKFKNGNDPFSMYQTLTKGYGMMTPQHWMVPKQKYDVIHYIREAYLKSYNPSQYAAVDQPYLDALPKGSEQGPNGVLHEPWAMMDYGPSLIATYEIPDLDSSNSHDKNPKHPPKPNFAYKGIAIRLDPGEGGIARGHVFMMFDHDTMRMAAAWSEPGFIDYNCIHFNGRHQVHPRLVGKVHMGLPIGPGWANPANEDFEDPRLRGLDGQPYGPLPRDWAHYKGLYHFGQRVIVAYSVGKAEVLESPGYESDPQHPQVLIFNRTINIGPSPHDLLLRIAPATLAAQVVCQRPVSLLEKNGFKLLRIPATSTPIALKVLHCDGQQSMLDAYVRNSLPPQDLSPFLKGGPRHWPQLIKTPIKLGKPDGPFAMDTFAIPEANPWMAQTRLSGFDFFKDGDRAAICSWDGDVWLVRGLLSNDEHLSWQRIASGLFQPLGLKIVNEQIFVCCRDQIVRLHDLNGDGETDYYENFNNDHQVTEHFHEFAMGLQADAKGNFYYARAARHALKALVPHHGTLLQVTPDGRQTHILATGFRAPNGVCLNPDGTFFLTDQEGFWLPKNRINLVEVGSFHGNFWGYHNVKDASDAAMAQPVCWITNSFDRSPSELLWVSSDQWWPLKGSLLNFSYGYGKIFVVPFENVHGKVQGGMCALPLPPIPTGVMRGRFNPRDGQLYCCGLFAWAGNQTQPGGFYRVRYTGQPVYLPTQLKAVKTGINITYSDTLDASSVGDVKNYYVKVWDLKRSAAYGSQHYNERELKVKAASLSADGKTISLVIADLQPTWCMEIIYSVRTSRGKPVQGTIHNTIHQLGDD